MGRTIVPKLKTHKGIVKRMKVTRKGKLKFKRCGKSHLMSSKGGKRGRHLRRRGVMSGIEAKKMISLIHN
jgi:large subunit ribosomal protein L35